MNSYKCTGWLVRDPELHTFDSGDRVCNFTLAVTERRYLDPDTQEWKEETSFLPFKAWNKTADVVMERYRKGSFMLVTESAVKTEHWKDKETTDPRQRFVFTAYRVEPLPTLNARESDPDAKPEPAGRGKGPARGRGGKKTDPDAVPVDGGREDDDIPF